MPKSQTDTERLPRKMYPGGQLHHSPPPNQLHYEVRKTRTGDGIFAAADLPADTLIASTHPLSKAPHRGRTSFELAPGQHYELSHPAPLINHSCLPNLSVRDNQHGGLDFVTTDQVTAGSQLRTHYAMHEWRSVSVSYCKCGHTGCHGRAPGYAELPPEEQETIAALGAARHLTHSDPLAPPRGLHSTITIAGIDPDHVPRDTNGGRVRVRMFLDQLVRTIGMNPHGQPVMDYYPTDGSTREGWTAVQLIDTSSVTLHLYRSGSAWVDITSCAPFDVKATAAWVQTSLQGQSYQQSAMELF